MLKKCHSILHFKSNIIHHIKSAFLELGNNHTNLGLFRFFSNVFLFNQKANFINILSIERFKGYQHYLGIEFKGYSRERNLEPGSIDVNHASYDVWDVLYLVAILPVL